MDLFGQAEQHTINIVPCDGIVNYHGMILSQSEADRYYQALLNDIAWQHDRAIIFGKEIITKRKVAWYASAPFSYTYSKVTKTALPWAAVLLELKKQVEHHTAETYNSCLLNLYHNGSEGMAWHSDGEKELKKYGAIASLSLGAERKFSFKHKSTKQAISTVLEHGSLLVMKGDTQKYWLHCLPLTKTEQTSRINLTFRTIITR